MTQLSGDRELGTSLNELARYIAQNNREKGFVWDREDLPKAAVLMISEIVEAVEEDRKFGKDEKIVEELADAIIRILDYAGQMGWDIGKVLYNKVEFNKTRPFKHNKKY